MKKPPQKTEILESLFHTPTEASRQVFYCVLRAGHLISGEDYRKAHPNYPGHKLLLCLHGNGFVKVNDRDWSVGPGDIAWIFRGDDNSHWPAKGSPWEMYWIRVDGPQMDQIHRILTTAGSPVFSGVNTTKTAAIYRRIFKILKRRPIAMEAALHSEVALLINQLFEARHEANPQSTSEIPNSLRKPLEAMRLKYDQPLTVGELARMAGMSESSFHRQFKAATGTSPIDWLKRERINQAKRLLLETDDTIGEIADKTGYYDQFYFSRDFKRMTELSPSEYRQRERLQKKYKRV